MQPAAIAALRYALGHDHVSVEPVQLARAASATFATTQRISAIVRPANRDEVETCVRLARVHRLALQPTSCGKNWGYGSRVPMRDGAVLLDLGRMTAIRGYDAELGHITVEPGVTQAQLLEYLIAQGAPYWIDTVTASPHTSVLGNTLERGHGLTPYADHAAHVTSLEVVLGNASCVRTGFGAFGDGPLAALDGRGVGPQLDGLFVQSSFGIVTAMSLALFPAPEHVELAMLVADDDDRFARMLDALRPLRMAGTLRMGPQVWNHYRTVQRAMTYPWDLLAGATPLPPDRALELARQVGGAAWTGVAGLYGSRDEVAAQRTRVAAALRATGATATFVDGEALASSPQSPAARVFAYATGRAESMTLGAARAYWRKREPAPPGLPDLDRDRCGFVWVPAELPFTGRAATEVARLASGEILGHGFEPDVAFVGLRERALHAHLGFIYDRDRAGDDERALECSDALALRLAQAGFHPPRLGVHTAAAMTRVVPAYAELLRALKRALDPDGVIANGRYDP